ncbi:S-layer homology domain-containing protein [Caloranaerobacter ferrireducens]|uniref:S-layer homology domain-containing protein n=1 Tax=Caloranaerobacter ferrireducens TaxID=1323370 RepID=UPI00084DB39E|nr:S-layer homology domain-containing protein [Caloranaerobacter ferrireducens]
MYKKNRFAVFFIFILLFLNSTISLASLDDRLKGHWAEKLIDKEFFAEHFYYLYKEDYKNFSPNKPISKKDFYYSLFSLMKRYENQSVDILGYNEESIEDEDLKDEFITRKEIISLLVKCLEAYEGHIEIYELINPFIDLDNIDEKYKRDILIGYKLGLVKGYSDGTFKPNNKVSQVESILLLQRLEGELSMHKSDIPFRVVDNKKVYTQINKQISIKENEEKITITIYKKLPNPGYNVSIQKIIKNEDGRYNIYIKTIPSDKYKMNLQVITFNVITIEIDKNYLIDDSYLFNVIDDTVEHNKYDKSIDM